MRAGRTDVALARASDKPSHAHRVVGEAVPDGKQQPRHEPQARLGVRREVAGLVIPERARLGFGRVAPVRRLKLGAGRRLAGRRGG